MKLLMIDNYDSFTFNIVQYFGELGAEVVTLRNDEVTLDELDARFKAGQFARNLHSIKIGGLHTEQRSQCEREQPAEGLQRGVVRARRSAVSGVEPRKIRLMDCSLLGFRRGPRQRWCGVERWRRRGLGGGCGRLLGRDLNVRRRCCGRLCGERRGAPTAAQHAGKDARQLSVAWPWRSRCDPGRLH